MYLFIRAETASRPRTSEMCSCDSLAPTRTRRYGLLWNPSSTEPNPDSWRFIVGDRFWVTVNWTVSIERSRQVVSTSPVEASSVSLPKMYVFAHGLEPTIGRASTGVSSALALSQTCSRLCPYDSVIVV